MAFKKSLRVLRDRALTTVLIIALCAFTPLTLPGVRPEMGAALVSLARLQMFDEDRARPEDPAPDDDDEKEKADAAETEAAQSGKSGGNAFKKIVTAPVRLMARLFRGGSDDKKPEMLVSKPTAKDVERFAAAPAPLIRTEEQAAAETSATDTSATETPLPDNHATAATAAERAAAVWFDQAVELHERGRLDAAIDKLNAALALRPKYAEAHNLLAVCYDQQGQYRRAQDEYKKAIKLESSNPRFLNNLGYSYYLSGDYKNAIKWGKKALQLTPDDRRLLNNLGLAYGRRGEYDRAFEHFLRAVGETAAHLNLGYVYSQQGRYEDAIKHYEVALRAQPQSSQAMSNLAQLYERVGRLRDAALMNEQYKKLQQRNQTVDHK
jgi:Flp pilus assembly protein TadD